MTGEHFEFEDLRPTLEQESFADHVRRGLSADQKWLSPRFFYDERGSELFERITKLPEYYPYDSERRILQSNAREITRYLDGSGALVELGSGSAEKTRILLEAALEEYSSVRFVPIDISGEFLRETATDLIKSFDGLRVSAIAGTYEAALDHLPDVEGNRLFLFLGGNIGNYTPEEARDLLSKISTKMTPGDRLMVGIDLLKDPNVIERAYNDEQGVTAAFNKNILHRINRELDGTFDPDTFRHHAPFVPDRQRIEMHLVSKRRQTVSIRSIDTRVEFEEGESIHTENSHKFDRDSFRELYRHTDLEEERFLRDDRNYFAEVILS